MQPIIKQSKADLERLESIIQQNIGAFYEVGRALMKIRDQNYYRDVLGYDTFEDYCKERWDFSRQRAYQLIDSVTIKNNLSTGVDIEVTEYQIRPLARLKPEQQRTAWQKAVETAPEGKVTAAHVSKVVREMVPQKTENPVLTVKEDSRNLSSIKTMWNVCNKKEKTDFIKWVKENFNSYLK